MRFTGSIERAAGEATRDAPVSRIPPRVFVGSATVPVDGGELRWVVALLALVGAALVAFATRWGIGVSPDSIAYVAGARNLAAGNGFVLGQGATATAITHWPPLYSFVLAGLGTLGIDPLVGARWLGALLFGANVGVVGGILTRGGAGRGATVLGALLTVGSVDLLHVHAMAWTEPLFLLLLLIGLAALARHLEHPGWPQLLLAGGAFGLAFLTRYSGAVLVPTGVLALWLLGVGRWTRRLRDSMAFLVLSAGPVLLWMLRNGTAGGSATDRELLFHPPTLAHLEALAVTVAGWFFSPDLSIPLRVALLLVGGGMLFAAVWRGGAQDLPRGRAWRSAARARPLASVFLLFAACYFVFLLVSIAFIDAHIPLDFRLLAPLYVALLATACLLLPGLVGRPRGGARRTVVLLAALLAASSLWRAGAWAAEARAEGLQYSSREWKEAGMLEMVARLPAATPVFSNADDVLHFHTGRPVRSLPWKWDPFTRRPNADYARDLDAMRAALRGGGVLAYSEMIDWREYLPNLEELRRVLPLEPVYRGPDGLVFRLRAASAPAARR